MKREVFSEKVLSLMEPLYYVASSILAVQADRDDALQNALEKGLRRCDALRDEAKLRAWITRIVVNECKALLRQKKRIVLTDEFPQQAVEDMDVALHEAVSSLPDKLRLPFMLKVEGYQVSEISAILRIPMGTVKHRLYQARQVLRTELTDEYEVSI